MLQPQEPNRLSVRLVDSFLLLLMVFPSVFLLNTSKLYHLIQSLFFVNGLLIVCSQLYSSIENACIQRIFFSKHRHNKLYVSPKPLLKQIKNCGYRPAALSHLQYFLK